MVQTITASMQLLAKLKGAIGDIGEDLENKLRGIAIPLVLIIAKVRDAIAKANATLLTTVFTTMSVYSIIVSGLLSVTTIVVDLLIEMAAVITAMFVVALALMMTPAFPVGATLFAVANTALNVIFIPTVVIYALIQTFMSVVFGKAADPAPDIPKGKKKKK
jgi:hypothetical protein